MDNGVRSVLLVMAMRAEAEPVLQSLRASWGLGSRDVPETALSPPLPARAWVCPRPAGGTAVLAITGSDPRYGVDCVATQAAALATDAAIRGHAPDLVLSVGTAGALASEAALGEVFYASEFMFHDRRIFGVGDDDAYAAYGIGRVPAAPLPSPSSRTPRRHAIVSTGNALNPVAEDFRLMAEHGAFLKEMEAAAVAWVAGLHDVPCGGVKVVTDLYPEESVRRLSECPSCAADASAGPGRFEEAREFVANFEPCVRTLAEEIPPLLDRIFAA